MAQSPLTLVEENGVGGIVSGKSFLSVLLGVFLNWSVGHHFNQHAHTITDLIAMPIEKVFPTNCPLTRKNRESYWIANYDSVSFGANSRE